MMPQGGKGLRWRLKNSIILPGGILIRAVNQGLGLFVVENQRLIQSFLKMVPV